MANDQWVPVCQYCGKSGTITRGNGGYMPNKDPKVWASCPNSPNKIHKATWNPVC